MATVLDYSLLGQFSGFFLWLLIFFVTYGLLQVTDLLKLKDDSKLYGPIALVISILLSFSSSFMSIIAFSLPWFTVLILIAFFMLFFAKMFNPDLDTASLLSENPAIGGIFTALVVIIMLFAMSAGIGDQVLQAQTGVDTSQLSQQELQAGETIPQDTFVPASESSQTVTLDRQTNIIRTIFHPNVLGMVFLFFIAAAILFLITKPSGK